jgi:hypothetical protein
MKRRLGIAALVAAALVFGIEGILTILRQRNINVVIKVEDAQGVVVAPATESAATPDPQSDSSTLILDPDGRVVVNVRWDYKIGPRFPRTFVRAEALDQAGKVVAADRYTIDCGAASLECTGTTSMTLEYGVVEKAGTRATWPPGDYVVRVTRAFTELSSTLLVQQPIRVLSQPAQ